MKSIRYALLWRLGGGVLLLLVAGGAALYAGVSWLLVSQFDAGLETKLETFASLLLQDGDEIELEFADASMPQFSAEIDPEYFQIWLRGDGDDALFRSRSLDGGDLPRTFAPSGEPALVWDLALPDGRSGRAIGAEVQIQKQEWNIFRKKPEPASVVIVLAQGRGPLDDSLSALLWGTVAGILVLLGASVVLALRVVNTGLRPLDDLTHHAAAVEDPLRAPRFDAENAPRELRPVADGFNDLLDRIQTAFERERRTTANIAHELKTPVSELMILTDVALRYGDGAGETRRALEQARGIAEQMDALIAMLLKLARIESGRIPLEPEPIDLAEMVGECWSPLSAGATAKGQSFVGPKPGRTVTADRAALGVVLTNLLDNAVAYAPEKSTIRCAIESNGKACALVVSNPSNGLQADDVDKLTEPFWRASSSRGDRDHAGIGLALAHRLAELLQLELSFAAEEGVFSARVDFAARHLDVMPSTTA